MRRFFESQDSLFACANKLVLQIARPFKKILVCLLFCLVISLLMQLSRYNALAFSQLEKVVGLNGLEPSTSRLSGARSNQLSYKPIELQNRSGPED